MGLPTQRTGGKYLAVARLRGQFALYLRKSGFVLLARHLDVGPNPVEPRNNVVLGAVESGLRASLTNPVIAVVAGGIATMLIAAGAMRVFPGLRGLERVQRG